MTRPEAVDEVLRCARLVAETGGTDGYFLRELQIAIEGLDRLGAEQHRRAHEGDVWDHTQDEQAAALVRGVE